jgi:hypothetical protein
VDETSMSLLSHPNSPSVTTGKIRDGSLLATQ